MKTKIILLLLVIIASIFGYRSCQEDPIYKIEVSGVVLDTEDTPAPIEEVEIEYITDGSSNVVKSDNQGVFTLSLPKNTQAILNFRKKGYGFKSVVVYTDSSSSNAPKEYFLNASTIGTINAADGGTVTVTNTTSAGTISSDADWSKNKIGQLPLVLDDSGRVIGFTMPEGLKNIWNVQSNNKLKLSASSVRIRGNSLVNKSGQRATGQVSVEVSAVDIYAPNGMPGNNRAANMEGQIGTMQSFGAMSVKIYDEDQEYNLDEESKATATITMPVPDWQLRMKTDFPSSVPLLSFDENTGIWQQEGNAMYDDSLKAYVGEVGHFSTINFDIIKTGPSANIAFLMDASGVPFLETPNFDISIEVTTTRTPPDIRVRNISDTDAATALCGNGSELAFSLNRLPVASYNAVAIYDNNDATNNLLYVIKTNAGADIITNCPWPSSAHPDCSTVVGAPPVPTCAEIFSNEYSTTKGLGVSLFADQDDDILYAMCEADGTNNYIVSIAGRIATFGAGFDATGAEEVKIVFADSQGSCDVSQGGGCTITTTAADLTTETTDANINLLSTTQTGPPEDPEWVVQTIELIGYKSLIFTGTCDTGAICVLLEEVTSGNEIASFISAIGNCNVDL